MTAETAADAARSAESSADSANASAMSTEFEVTNVQGVVKALRTVVEDLRDRTPEGLASQLTSSRRKVWWNFTADTFQHGSTLAEQLNKRLRVLLAREISVDPAQSAWELALWEDVLVERMAQPRQRGTQKWWRIILQTVEAYSRSPSYAAPELPDLRAALREDIDHELDDPLSATRTFEALLNE
jgi:hypothetical protein